MRGSGGDRAEGETGVQADAGGGGTCLFRQGDDGGAAASNQGGGVGCRPVLAHLVGRGRGATGACDGESHRAAGVRRRRADAQMGCHEPDAGLGDYADDC